MCDFCDKYEKEKYFTSFQIKKAIFSGFVPEKYTGDELITWGKAVMRDTTGHKYAACSDCAHFIQGILDGEKWGWAKVKEGWVSKILPKNNP